MNEPIAIINLLILGITAYTSYRGFKSDRFVDAYIFSPINILRDKEYYRLVTSGFIHSNVIHLIFNMYSLYSFGSYIEYAYGALVFLLIYMSSILGGNLLSLYLHRHHEYHALGASGGVCGIIFASIFLLPGGSIIMFPLPIPIPSWLYAILFIIVSFFGMRTQTGNIGHDAHLGGALVGLVVATLLYPTIIARNLFLYVSIVFISAGLLLYAYRFSCQHTSAIATLSYWRRLLTGFRAAADAKRKTAKVDAVDRLLSKVSASGVSSLSPAEKAHLDSLSRSKDL